MTENFPNSIIYKNKLNSIANLAQKKATVKPATTFQNSPWWVVDHVLPVHKKE